MIVFCLRCWHEVASEQDTCPHCGARLDVDSRSYEEKLIAALDHPLPQARVRICWLIGENGIDAAVEKLITMACEDPDLFVKRAAVEALGRLHSEKITPFLETLLAASDVWLAADARSSLELQRVRNRSTSSGIAIGHETVN